MHKGFTLEGVAAGAKAARTILAQEYVNADPR